MCYHDSVVYVTLTIIIDEIKPSSDLIKNRDFGCIYMYTIIQKSICVRENNNVNMFHSEPLNKFSSINIPNKSLQS